MNEKYDRLSSFDLISNISSTENDVNLRIDKAWITTDRLTMIRKSDLSGKNKILLNCIRVSTTV